MDETRHRKITDECMKLAIERNKIYGDTFEVVDIHTLVGLCLMKLNRVYKLGTASAKTKDELLDSINYLVFALEKYNRGEK